ncbi:hypothetical protein RKD26_005840 [Streptomyces calvus]|uniref:hypothetical protein n=1 Tax=Streptomyces calvus TaxID=67282 RepID=UPI003517F7C2
MSHAPVVCPALSFARPDDPAAFHGLSRTVTTGPVAPDSTGQATPSGPVTGEPGPDRTVVQNVTASAPARAEETSAPAV